MEIAPKYDFITRALSLGADNAWKDELVEKLPQINRPRCLDLACGTGDITFRLANKYPAGLVVGLDLAEEMLARARFCNLSSNIQFVINDMCRTGFDDNSFDIVTGGYALRNAPDIKKVLTEIWRVMRFGGTGAFLDFSKPTNTVSQKLENALLKIWGSFWGLVLHGNTEVYTYIAESLKQFPNCEQLKQYLNEKGFVNIRSKKHFYGIIEIILFEKNGR